MNLPAGASESFHWVRSRAWELTVLTTIGSLAAVTHLLVRKAGVAKGLPAFPRLQSETVQALSDGWVTLECVWCAQQKLSYSDQDR